MYDERIYTIIFNITYNLEHHPCQPEQPITTTSTPTARPQPTSSQQQTNRQPESNLQDQKIIGGNAQGGGGVYTL